MAMEKDEAVDHEIQREAERYDANNGGKAVGLACYLERFRQKIKKCDANNRARAKAENEVKSIAQTKREHAAEKRREKSGNRDEEDGHRIT
jgi:hypothetical protein